MKAIQTRYKGYNMRSRGEARWACFFDALGLKWEYEPEGFDLGEAGFYLPDFRVHYPGYKPVWFEVKGDLHDITGEEWAKMEAFGQEDLLILLHGAPAARAYFEPVGPRKALEGYAREKDGEWGFSDDDVLNLRDSGWFDKGPDWLESYRYGYFLWGDDSYLTRWEQEEGLIGGLGASYTVLERAVNAARSARFEHGESGPT